MSILAGRETTEDYGSCYGMMLLYSGNFSFEVEQDRYHQVRMQMGMQDEMMDYQLVPGENLCVPEVAMVYTAKGLAAMSHRFHRLVLDFSRKEVVDHVFSQIVKVLDSAEIEYIKMDMNRSLCDIYTWLQEEASGCRVSLCGGEAACQAMDRQRTAKRPKTDRRSLFYRKCTDACRASGSDGTGKIRRHAAAFLPRAKRCINIKNRFSRENKADCTQKRNQEKIVRAVGGLIKSPDRSIAVRKQGCIKE